jgi:hypothetical protein
MRQILKAALPSVSSYSSIARPLVLAGKAGVEPAFSVAWKVKPSWAANSPAPRMARLSSFGGGETSFAFHNQAVGGDALMGGTEL